MHEKEHFKRLQQYYKGSEIEYDLILGGSKHLGFYPKGENISEKKAQILLQELVGKKIKLSSEDIVLDAGCGQGLVSTFLAKKYDCKIEGITVVPFEVKKAKLLAEKVKVEKQTNYSLMDYNKIEFNNNYFNCIYTTETLSHSIDIKRTLKEFFRVLKRGGRIALFEYTLADDKEFSKSEMKILNRVIRGSAMSGLKDFRHDKFQNVVLGVGFTDVEVDDVTENMGPSFLKLKRLGVIPYYLFVKPFGLQEKFPNVSAAVELYNMANKGLIRYCIFTAVK